MAELNRYDSQGPKDRQRVDVGREWECDWWSEAWGVSVEQLKAAVREVGPLVVYVDRYLSDKKAAR